MRTIVFIIMSVVLGPIEVFAGANQDIQLISKGLCGRNQSGSSLYVRNSNKKRAITVILNDVRRLNGQKTNAYMLTRVVPAGGDVAAGCTKDLSGNNGVVENEYKIISARYN